MADFIIFAIIIIIVIIGRVLQAVGESQKKGPRDAQGREGGRRPKSYTASPDDIRQFLAGLGAPTARQPRREEDEEQPPPPPPEPASPPLYEPEAGAVFKSTPIDAAPEQLVDDGRSGGMPAGPVLGQPAEPMKRSRRTRTAAQKGGRQKKSAAAAQARRHLKTESTPVSAARPGLPTAASLRGGNLKQAVIWSEILGRPVGLRRMRGNRPPASRR